MTFIASYCNKTNLATYKLATMLAKAVQNFEWKSMQYFLITFLSFAHVVCQIKRFIKKTEFLDNSFENTLTYDWH